MFLNYRILKAESKATLKGKDTGIKLAFLTMMTFTTLCLVPSYMLAIPVYSKTLHLPLYFPHTSAITPLALIMLMFGSYAIMAVIPPMHFSLVKMTTDVFATGQESRYADFWKNFRFFGKAQGLFWWTYLKTALWILALEAVLFTLTFLTALFRQFSRFLSILTIIVLTLAVIAGTVFIIYKTISYSLNIFISAFDQEQGPIKATKVSVMITKGKVWNLFGLGISFFGWYLLGAITFGITNIFKYPYIAGTYVLASDELKKQYVAQKEAAND